MGLHSGGLDALNPGAGIPGSLHVFLPSKRLVTFVTAPKDTRPGADVHPPTAAVVFVAGLTDGLLATPYVPALARAVTALGAALVTPLLSSSYGGYGVSSLESDSAELEALLVWLAARGFTRAVFCGHSTGCQNALHVLDRLRRSSKDTRQDTDAATPQAVPIVGVVLQAPVSDVEYAETLPETAALVAAARAMVGAGRGEELMPRDASDAPITARRYLSLSTTGGDDDMFSGRGATPAATVARFVAPVTVPVLLVYSGSDEYVPAAVLPLQKQRGEELLAAMAPVVGDGGSLRRVVVVGGADHALSGPDHTRRFAEEVGSFVAGVLERTGVDGAGGDSKVGSGGGAGAGPERGAVGTA